MTALDEFCWSCGEPAEWTDCVIRLTPDPVPLCDLCAVALNPKEAD